MPAGNESEQVRNKISEITSVGSKEYLIAAKRGPQVRLSGQIMPLSAHQFQATLSSIPAIKVKKTIPRHGAAAPMSMFSGEATDVVVADIEQNAAPALQASARASGIIIEPNEPLDYVGMSLFRAPAYQPPMPVGAAVEARKIQIRVLGAGDAPLSDATVMLQADGFMQNGKTNSKGDVTLDLWTMGEGPARYVWVKPKANHWDRYIVTPELVDGSINVVRLQAFSETIPGFPENFGRGWGQKMMGLPNLPDFAKGKGVKIAIIDSGADTNHPLLNHIKLGLDASTGGQRDGWKVDAIGHGSHVAGVITANGGGRSMYTGFAPEAEIHVIKVFPGGYDTLIQALNYCVAQRVDVVNMSLGGAEISVAVEQALQEATLAGIACIVAAGNSGDAVKYPASSPNALAVGAVGNTVETRAQSWAQTQIIVDSIAADGTYPAKFSCHGPQIGVCAPGVAIVSTLPGDSYGTDDGTSMASPHVTGLAALILAHHPLFRTTLAERNQARVAALFSIVRDLCTGYAFSDGRAGAGMPTLTQSAVREFIQGLDPSQGAIPVAHQGTSPGVPAGGEQLHALSAFPGQDGNGGRDQRVWLGRQTGHPDGQFVWAAGPGQFGGLVWVPSPGISASPLGNTFVRSGQGVPYFRG